MLMEIFEEDKPGNAALDHLNRVRLFLGVTTLADICDDDGKKILAKALIGYKRFRPVTQWPNQEKSSKYSWQLWRWFLCKYFAQIVPKNAKLDSDWVLDEDLGVWTTPNLLIFRETYL
eukprot:7259550-Ditylum_brightwellii.AAC.1